MEWHHTQMNNYRTYLTTYWQESHRSHTHDVHQVCAQRSRIENRLIFGDGVKYVR